MANEELLAILRQGNEAWNTWRKANRAIYPDLTGLDLTVAKLSGADLSKAQLSRARLNGAHLSGADLSGADLSGANLSKAYLWEANLSEAYLSGADLSDAHLWRADLSKAVLNRAILNRADLREANLSMVRLEETIFSNVDLSTVKGLDQVQHRGPSTLGIDTLYRSGGQVSEIFLRGCGVPESLIEYLPSHIRSLQPIQYYSCFISYSSVNEEFARRLHGRMQQAGLRVWFGPDELRGGHKLHDQIDEAIRVYDKLILVLSEASIRSGWVETELRKAFQKERRENRRTLFPIGLVDYPALANWRISDSSGKDLAEEVRTYFIPDFTNWKDHDAFEAAFAKLLTALKATTLPSGDTP